MSARQAFVPHGLSETRPQSTDVRENDGGKDTFVGKPRSLSALLGQKTSPVTDTTSQGSGQPKTPSLAKTSSNRRSFDGIIRPEIPPMSIIPYPATMQFGARGKQTRPGQTPRKNIVTGPLEFSRPMTPESAPRGPKRPGTFPETREDEVMSNGNEQSSARIQNESDEEGDARISTGSGMGGYMRMLDRIGSGGKTSGTRSHLERDVTAPEPEYAFGGLGQDLADAEHETDSTFGQVPESFDAMIEMGTRLERNHGPQKGFSRAKRGMPHEGVEDHQQGPKRTRRRVQQDSNEYSPISTPRTAPSPKEPTSIATAFEPSQVANSLFENIGEFVDLKEIESDSKRWRECTTEEWLKDADQLTQDYADILNMVKDHLTEKVLTFANMISSVEEKGTEIARNTKTMQERGNVVLENISKLGLMQGSVALAK